jgi:hypothetical protein
LVLTGRGYAATFPAWVECVLRRAPVQRVETVVEPIILGLEADEKTGRLAVARDHDLLLRRLA